MRLTSANKEKLTAYVKGCAARELRRHGYSAVNLDQVMASAGLTRGAFYAHFKSKRDLLRVVVRTEHPVLRMLERRDGKDAIALCEQMRQIFRRYLDPNNLSEIFNECSAAALTGDVVRAAPDVKAAYAAAWQDIMAEMSRGQPAPPAAFAGVLALAVGAVQAAQASDNVTLREEILSAAWKGFDQLLSTICAESIRSESPKNDFKRDI